MKHLGFMGVVVVAALATAHGVASAVEVEAGAESLWQVTVVDNAQVGERVSMAVGRDGAVHLAYYEFVTPTVRRLKYARGQGGIFAVELVDDAGDVGGMPSLALAPSGEPSISYFDFAHQSLKLARRTAGAWKVEVVDGEEAVGLDSSLAIDRHGRAHVAYYDLANRHLKYARWTGSAWALETVDDGLDAGQDASLALDDADRPHVAYLDRAARHLKYAASDGRSWSVSTVDRARDVGFGASLALRHGVPWIAYLDLRREKVKLAWLDRQQWSVDTVAAAPAGSRVNLVLDAGGSPHLGLQLRGSSARYAHRAGDAWTFESVEEGSGKGYATAVAIDGAGGVHLAYADPGRRVLKYAHEACEGPGSWAMARHK
jgi:hypothetical protein